ncbi:hypothetical protein [Sporolactobacillus pectinivorans]|uniref:hypothetical protein n=1 Tax=Sporolactobacillus pectinivorans TaxID=1591408 RepID=UPI000C265CD9|nr:hypothetical protein [Sporolactobacillus pectinivorans]
MLKILRFIHYTAGMVGSLIVLLMSITGILLNHRSLIGYSSAASMKIQTLIFALHSGYVGNTSIVWLTDIGAICMIVLSISGVWMWISFVIKISKGRKRRRKRNG